jgi:hypothetical protein
MEGEDARGYLIPNIFYDVIVFLTPTLTFCLGLAIGFSLYRRIWDSIVKGGSATLSLLAGILVIFFFGYEFGRLAETFSDVFVAAPLRFLSRKNILFKNCDFQRDLSNQVASLSIVNELFEGRGKSKWSLYFFALEHTPYIGADLLKRYAWEKLARSAAFAFLCLSVLSALFLLHNIIFSQQLYSSRFQVGSFSFFFACAFMYLVCSVDYYKRNCWNSDLLITTMPIIVDAVVRREKAANSKTPEMK